MFARSALNATSTQERSLSISPNPERRIKNETCSDNGYYGLYGPDVRRRVSEPEARTTVDVHSDHNEG